MTADEVAKDIVDRAIKVHRALELIINWNVILLRDGIQRVVRNHPEELTSG